MTSVPCCFFCGVPFALPLGPICLNIQRKMGVVAQLYARPHIFGPPTSATFSSHLSRMYRISPLDQISRYYFILIFWFFRNKKSKAYQFAANGKPILIAVERRGASNLKQPFLGYGIIIKTKIKQIIIRNYLSFLRSDFRNAILEAPHTPISITEKQEFFMIITKPYNYWFVHPHIYAQHYF